MLALRSRFILVLIQILFIQPSLTFDETYKEELYVRPLPTGQTYFNLLFTTTGSVDLVRSNLGKT